MRQVSARTSFTAGRDSNPLGLASAPIEILGLIREHETGHWKSGWYRDLERVGGGVAGTNRSHEGISVLPDANSPENSSQRKPASRAHGPALKQVPAFIAARCRRATCRTRKIRATFLVRTFVRLVSRKMFSALKLWSRCRTVLWTCRFVHKTAPYLCTYLWV